MHPDYAGKNKQRLIDAFQKQALVRSKTPSDVAEKFAEVAEVDEYSKDELLFSTEKRTDMVYFVFSGKVDLLIGKRCIYSAKPGDILGEFPVLDQQARHVVTAKVRAVSEIASVTNKQFVSIAEKYPDIVWRNLAIILATRIRERNESQTEWLGLLADLKVANLWKVISAMPAVAKIISVAMGGLLALGAGYNWLWAAK